MAYAKDTSVPVGRSQEHIRQVLTQHGATEFAFAESRERAAVTFKLKNADGEFRLIRVFIPFPIPPPAGATQASIKTFDQIVRARWRVLLLAIKAKLECVDAHVTTLEEEFLSFIILPDGQTVAQAIQPQLQRAYKEGKMPPLLGYSGAKE